MCVVVKIELMIEVETQVVQDGFRENNGAFYREEINEWVGRMSSSCEVEEFSFAVFHYKTSIKEDFRHDIVTTE